MNVLPNEISPYIVYPKCEYDKHVTLNYKSKRGYHHIYKIITIHITTKARFYPAFLVYNHFLTFWMTFLLYKKKKDNLS